MTHELLNLSLHHAASRIKRRELSPVDLTRAHALGKARSFSEYILYGYFVSQSPTHRARHRLTTQSLATSHWEHDTLDEAALIAMVEKSPSDVVALCIESFSSTPVSLIRKVAGLADNDVPLQPTQDASAVREAV